MTQATYTPRSWALLALLALIWGASFLTTTTLVETMSPLHVVTHRVIWAAAALWGWALIRRLPLPRDARTWGALFVMGLLNNALPFTLQAYAQTTIESGLAGILNATAAIFGVLVAAAVFADERLTPQKLAGVTLGFIGVAVIIGPEALTGFDPRSKAQLAMLGSTLLYGLSTAWARAHLTRIRPEVAAMGMLTGASLIMLPLSWLTVGPLPLHLPALTLAQLAVYAVVITAVAYLIYYRLIASMGAGGATLVTLLIPPVAIGLGAWVRAEALGPHAYLGFGLIAAGLVVLNRKRR